MKNRKTFCQLFPLQIDACDTSGYSSRPSGRRGATMVIMCVLLPITLVLASFCINVVYMEMTRTELQIATDVATRAAGRILSVSGDKTKAEAAVARMLNANPVSNVALPTSAVDIVYGVSTRKSETERYAFQQKTTDINALMVQTNGTYSPPMLFPTMGVSLNFRPFKTAISTQTELDISLVLDRSGSMAYASDEIQTSALPAAAPAGWAYGDPVPVPSRWMDTNQAVQDFLGILNGTVHAESVSMSSYSSNGVVDVPLTPNYGDIQIALHNYSAKFDDGMTNIGDGMLQGLKSLGDKKYARAWASRIMIVLSDGRHNTGADPIAAATAVANEDVHIYTISFSSQADTALMQEIADIGSGKHFHASSGLQLQQIFSEIAHGLPTLITL